MRVLRREAHGFEVPLRGQRAHIQGRIRWQLGHGHHRKCLPHAGTLGGVVIDEDQAVQADIERFCNAAQVLGLVLPIGDEAGDVLVTQGHLGVAAEGVLGDLGVVLRAHRQDHPAVLQPLRVALQLEVGLADGAALAQDQSFDAHVADHAAPQRIVEIEYRALARPAALRRDDTCRQFAEAPGRLRGNLHLALQPARGVEPGVEAIARAGPGDIQQRDAVLARRLGQQLVQPVHQPRRRGNGHAVETAENGLEYIEVGLLQDDRTETAPRSLPQAAQLLHLDLEQLLDLLGIGIRRHRSDHAAGAQREHDDLRREVAQRIRRLHQLMPILPEATGKHVEVETVPHPGHPQAGHKVRRRGGRQQGHAHTRQRSIDRDRRYAGERPIQLNRLEVAGHLPGQGTQVLQPCRHVLDREGLLEAAAKFRGVFVVWHRQPAISRPRVALRRCPPPCSVRARARPLPGRQPTTAPRCVNRGASRRRS